MTLVFIVGLALSAIFQSGEVVSVFRPYVMSPIDVTGPLNSVSRLRHTCTKLTPQWSLHKDHPDRKSLLRNSKIKLAIVGLAIATAIAFGVTYGIVSSLSCISSCLEYQCLRRVFCAELIISAAETQLPPDPDPPSNAIVSLQPLAPWNGP